MAVLTDSTPYPTQTSPIETGIEGEPSISSTPRFDGPEDLQVIAGNSLLHDDIDIQQADINAEHGVTSIHRGREIVAEREARNQQLDDTSLPQDPNLESGPSLIEIYNEQRITRVGVKQRTHDVLGRSPDRQLSDKLVGAVVQAGRNAVSTSVEVTRSVLGIGEGRNGAANNPAEALVRMRRHQDAVALSLDSAGRYSVGHPVNPYQKPLNLKSVK